jgi:hypothetical protein
MDKHTIRHDGNPLTPEPTRKAEALTKTPTTIASRREENVALKKWSKPWLCCANGILETKENDGNTVAKAPVPRTNPNTKEAPTTPKPHTHPSHERDGQAFLFIVVYYDFNVSLFFFLLFIINR